MYIKNYENFDIEYGDMDIEYIDLLIESLLSKQEEIMSFFKIFRLDKKIKIKMWNNLDEYRKYVNDMLQKYNKVIPDWECGRSTNNPEESKIDVISYKERLKCKGHQNDTLDNMIKVTIHEFVHTCHTQYKDYKRSLTWYSEALATVLSEQYDPINLKLNCELDDILNARTNYEYYFSLGKYIFEVYGGEYALKLAKEPDFLESETPRLFSEAKKWIAEKEQQARKF